MFGYRPVLFYILVKFLIVYIFIEKLCQIFSRNAANFKAAASPKIHRSLHFTQTHAATAQQQYTVSQSVLLLFFFFLYLLLVAKPGQIYCLCFVSTGMRVYKRGGGKTWEICRGTFSHS